MSTPSYSITLDNTRYDQEQINLMEERLILLSVDDVAIGEGSKKDCSSTLPPSFRFPLLPLETPHSLSLYITTGHLIPPPSTSTTTTTSDGKSPLHRAFSVFLFHPTTGQLLLQKRADEKITFPSMWTNTCCSHPLSTADEREEVGEIGVRRAASRKLVHELGIPISYPLDAFAYLTRIHYYASSDEIWAEHEIDYILFLTLDPTIEPNLNEVSEIKWVSKAELQAFFLDPSNSFTPWFKLIAESFLYKWWDSLESTSKPLDARNLMEEVHSQRETMSGILRM